MNPKPLKSIQVGFVWELFEPSRNVKQILHFVLSFKAITAQIMLGHLILREYTGFFIGNSDKPWVKTRKIRSIKGVRSRNRWFRRYSEISNFLRSTCLKERWFIVLWSTNYRFFGHETYFKKLIWPLFGQQYLLSSWYRSLKI